MEAETILIGSGVSAAAVAKQILAEDPGHSLLILEAGPKVPSKDRRLWWDLVVSGRSAYDQCHDLPLPLENKSKGETPWVFRESRMMGYGGSTFHWGGWALRFKDEDFHLFTNTGRGCDWPITYQDLESSYCDAEQLLGVSGSDPHHWHVRSKPFPHPAFEHAAADGPMIDAFDTMNIQYASMPVARFRKCMTTGTCKYCPFGARFAASYILDDLIESERHPNLKIQMRHPVSELILDRKNRVIGVRVLDVVTAQTKEFHARRFVICSGSYETPKLLLRSRSKYWVAGVGNDQGLVGRFLISHPFLFVRGKMPSNPHRYQQELDFPTLMSRHFDTPEEQAHGKLFLFRDRSKPRIDLAGLMTSGMHRKQIEERLVGETEWELQGFMEEFANPENRNELGKGLNRLGLPQTKVTFSRAEGFDQAAMKHLTLMREVMNRIGAKTAEISIAANVQTQRGDHAAATCRMARTPETGVVDENLRVHGVSNLYVCSNAVFPSGAAVNPTLTLAALALRLGRHLSKNR